MAEGGDWEVVRRRRRVTETGDPEAVEQPPSWRWVVAALIASLLLMVAVSIGVVHSAGQQARRPTVSQVQVPSEVGKAGEVAAAELAARGFVIDLQPEPNITVAPGTVVGQEPVAGSKLDQGGRVVLRVSSGPPGVKVPDVRGLAPAEATRSLSDVGLGSELVNVFDDKIRAGEVVSSAPRQGRTVLPSQVVKLSVSQGPRPRVVPTMVGRAAAAAMADLARAGLGAGTITFEPTSAAAPGVVLSTSPSAGTGLPPRYPVAVVVSAPVESVSVPDFVGLTRNGAATVAAAAKVRLDVRSQAVLPGTLGAGRVTSQTVLPGTAVASGSTVQVTVLVDPSQPAVPN